MYQLQNYLAINVSGSLAGGRLNRVRVDAAYPFRCLPGILQNSALILRTPREAATPSPPKTRNTPREMFRTHPTQDPPANETGHWRFRCYHEQLNKSVGFYSFAMVSALLPAEKFALQH
jgi:hypothetical protein